MQETQTNELALLFSALAKAQGAFQPIVKNRHVKITMKTGGSYNFKYADLEEIVSKTRPALSANGLAMIQTVDDGKLQCILTHAGGGSIKSTLAMPALRDVADPKSFGAAITYLRRYMVTSMLGVAADDDLDENGQETDFQPQAQTGQKPQVAQPQRKPQDAPPAACDSTPCTQGEIAYINKKLEAKGWTRQVACEAVGFEYVEGSVITKAEFAALKAAL